MDPGRGGRKKPRAPHLPIVLKPPSSPTPSATHELFIDKKKYSFKLEELVDQGSIGRGAFGRLSKMLFPPSNTVMAVKRIFGDDTENIIDHALIMKSGTCPYVVEVYGFFVENRYLCMCMELLDSSMDGVSRRVYDELHQTIPEGVLGKMSVAVIKGLQYLKSELAIIHRGVQPSNILVSSDCQFKLCDFDISRRDDDSSYSQIEHSPYLAPERLDPTKVGCDYTVLSDVWSFGITLLELTLGRFPYPVWRNIFEQLNTVLNGPPPTLPSDGSHSPELQEFTTACLCKDSTQRPYYDRLQEFTFFTKYNVTDVDVRLWYDSIRKQ